MTISIITINYNNVKGLHKTILSVIKQKTPNTEYIVIDGGSTDGSTDIIKNYAQDIDYWVSERDNGIYNAMNKGVAVAKGEYCIFLNSGDFFCKKILQEISEKDYKEDVVSFLCKNENDGKLRNNNYTQLSFLQFYRDAIPHQSTFIKTSILKENPYDETLKIVSDWKFFIQELIIKNRSFIKVDKILAVFNNEGISSTNNVLIRQERTKVMKELIPPRILVVLKKINYLHNEYIEYGNIINRTRHIYKITIFILCILSKISLFIERTKTRNYSGR